MPFAIGDHNCLDAYPDKAKDAETEGITSLSYYVTPDGAVRGVNVIKSSGCRMLDKAAVECVKKWKYTPAMLDGNAVETAWRNDVKWVLAVNRFIRPPGPIAALPLPPPAPPSPPPENTITVQNRQSSPPPITAPASIGRPHICTAEYPPDAVAEHAQGTVTLRFTIASDGSAKDISVDKSSGFAVLDDAAVSCASRWRYKPAIKDNQPIEVSWKAKVTWALN